MRLCISVFSSLNCSTVIQNGREKVHVQWKAEGQTRHPLCNKNRCLLSLNDI